MKNDHEKSNTFNRQLKRSTAQWIDKERVKLLMNVYFKEAILLFSDKLIKLNNEIEFTESADFIGNLIS